MVNAGRKRLFIALGIAVTLLCLASLPAAAADKPPIRVGILVSYTGIAPLQAKGVSDGIELALDEVQRKAGGRQIEVFKEDTAFDSNVGLTKVRRLIEEKKVNIVVGPISSAVALAIYDYVLQHNVIWVVPNAFTRELTSPEKANPKMFRTVETTDQANYVMGKWIIEHTPYRNIVITAQDYKAGHDSVDAFKAGFLAAGGKVVKEVYAKVGTMDFAPFLSSIDTKGADAVYAWYAGTDAIRFVQQYQEFGLKKRLPLLGGGAVIIDDPYLSSMGDAAVGVIASTHYPVNLDTPENHAFVKAYTAKYNEPPSRYSEYGYTAGKLITAGIEAAKGNVEDVSKLANAMKQVSSKIVTPSGPLTFDRYNQRVVTMYVEKAENKNGKVHNIVIDKIGKVSQEDTWKWWNK